MAAVSGLCSSSSNFKPQKLTSKSPTSPPPAISSVSLRKESITFPTCYQQSDRNTNLTPSHSVAREISADLSHTNAIPKGKKKSLEKEPRALWSRYLDWLYQHKELGLYLDVSRIGFTDEFLEEMEPRFQKAFRAMNELEKGAIANPDEGRMVGHYWLRKSELSPNSFLRAQIEKTLDAVCKFAEEVVSGKVSFSI